MSQPLAERMRPTTLDEYIGQRHLVGEGAVLRNMILSGRITSFILWGPPGVGKTTLAQIIAQTMKVPFYTLSAVTSGVKDVREVIQKAEGSRFFLAQSSGQWVGLGQVCGAELQAVGIGLFFAAVLVLDGVGQPKSGLPR